jgi:hypothetical protein
MCYIKYLNTFYEHINIYCIGQINVIETDSNLNGYSIF